jgi:hypothetical protein
MRAPDCDQDDALRHEKQKSRGKDQEQSIVRAPPEADEKSAIAKQAMQTAPERNGWSMIVQDCDSKISP